MLKYRSSGEEQKHENNLSGYNLSSNRAETRDGLKSDDNGESMYLLCLRVMGCTFSETSIRNFPGKELDAYVTKEDKRLVKQSWRTFGQDLDGNGFIVFTKLFAMQEHLKDLFSAMTSHKSGDKMFIDEEKLKSHGKIVMEALGSAVESLDDSVFLTNLLIAMGMKHSEYDVKTDMVVFFWPAIRDTMRDQLGDDFTPEVERAWSHVFEYIASKFAEGIRRGKKNGKNKADRLTGI